jgi:hypothetical protein
MELFARKDQQVETHGTCELFIVKGASTQSFYFATSSFEMDGVRWQPQMRKGSVIDASVTRAANRATVDLQNVDTVLGVEFVQLRKFLFGAEIKIGRYWRDLNSGVEDHKRFLTGMVVGVEASQEVVRLTAASDCYSGVSVGPVRRVTRLCPWRPFKGRECGYIGVESVCDFTFTGPGGCDTRHGPIVKLARFGGAPYLDTRAKLFAF